MHRWARGITTMAAIMGSLLIAPTAHAHTSKQAPNADSLFDAPQLPAAVLDCIADHWGLTDVAAVKRICPQWDQQLHVSIARNQDQIEDLLDDIEQSPVTIVVIPDAEMTITHTPANHKARIIVHDNRPFSEKKQPVSVTGNARVTASGTTALRARDSSRVTATDDVRVFADGHAHITAMGTSVVGIGGADAYGGFATWFKRDKPNRPRLTITAMENATVFVAVLTDPDALVAAQGPHAHVWTDNTYTAIDTSDSATLHTVSTEELDKRYESLTGKKLYVPTLTGIW